MTEYLQYNRKVPCCGIFCGGCPSFICTKNKCCGATTNCEQRKCGIYKCCVEKKSFLFCFECNTFPPYSRFKKFAETWLKLGQDLMENQKLIQKSGEADFLKFHTKIFNY